jgi:hypothetical protein
MAKTRAEEIAEEDEDAVEANKERFAKEKAEKEKQERERKKFLKKNKKKKKKVSPWKGKRPPQLTKGLPSLEWDRRWREWEKANPNYFENLERKSPSLKAPTFKVNPNTGRLEYEQMNAASGGSIEKNYAHGGSVRKTKLNDY